ncbi:MAG: hypothetical protein ACI9XJ_001899 [Marivirga sp.]|jgi:hypothetical protein
MVEDGLPYRGNQVNLFHFIGFGRKRSSDQPMLRLIKKRDLVGSIYFNSSELILKRAKIFLRKQINSFSCIIAQLVVRWQVS